MTHVSRFSAIDKQETKVLVQGSTRIYLRIATRLATTSRYQEGLNTDTDLHENCLYRHRYNTDPIIGGTLILRNQAHAGLRLAHA